MEELKHILFIDIETVPAVPDFEQLSDALKTEWKKKARYLKSSANENALPEELFFERAAIFSEFSKVVCICIGMLVEQDGRWVLRLKSISNDNEKVLLTEFCELITRFQKTHPGMRFCGHNIKEFDIPVICRRMLINGMALPECMQLSGKKPWEITHIDTLELWRFGDYKHFTSLALLAAVLGIPSPKEDIDGSMVGSVYWQDRDLPRIAKYCLGDVLTTAKVFLKLRGLHDIDPEPFVVNE